MNLYKENVKKIAAQLRKPDGPAGQEVLLELNTVNQMLTQRTLSTLGDSKGKRVLELGPGNGVLSHGLIDTLGPDGCYIGVEYSDQARHDFAEQLPEKDVHHCRVVFDDLNNPEQGYPCDAVFGVNVLYFIDNLEDLFSHILRWLSPGGRVVFGVRTKATLQNFDFSQHGFVLREDHEYTKALRSCGFIETVTDRVDEGEMDNNGEAVKLESLVVSALKSP